MPRFWNDPRRCLRVSDRCSGGSVLLAVAVFLAGVFDASWVVLVTLILVDAALALATFVLTVRADRLFRRETDRAR